ncbi:MAG: type II secretion system protein F [Lachnospiraceae bacterium]|nr:type II secretion system protein F [Lachnospiraceae bacterium]
MIKCKERLNVEFKDGLQAIKGALGAGYSFENSFSEAVDNLRVIYKDNSLLIPYFEKIEKKISLNIPVERALKDFAEETEIEEVINFSEVINIAKRTGGDLVHIASVSAERIRDSIDVKLQIQTMIAGKKLESSIMNYIPVLMILYLWVFSPDFLDCMYVGISSRIFMGVLFVLYMLFKFLAESIVEVR